MERLWSPWRSHFIETHDERPADYSPFAEAWERSDLDSENHLLHRGGGAFIILNKYPYNPGHLLVVPVRRVGDLLQLTDEERYEMSDLVSLGLEVLKRAMNPHGFNVGMNLGRTAGAAIESHVHTHIVPRWNGDTNFMPVLDETRVMSENMEKVFGKLREALDAILSERGSEEQGNV